MQAEFERLYGEEFPYVYAFLARLGMRTEELEDLTHDVFVTAFRRWDTYDPTKPARPWLLGIAFRVMVEFRRRGRSRERNLELNSVPAVEESAGERRVEHREARELVDLALAGLSEERRAVFVMYELEGMAVADISEAMNCPSQTTYSRLRVARQEFAAAVRRQQLLRGEA